MSLSPNKTYLKCNEGYGTELIQTDRYGFENEDKIWDEKNIDILIIGDSYAAGYCVNREDTISSKLNKYYSTINLSLAGNSPIIYSSIFKNYSLIKKFSNIIIIFTANDNIYEKNSSYDKKYIINDNKILFNINNSYLIDEKYLNFLHIAESYEKKFFFHNTKRGSTYLRFIKYLKLKRIRYFFNFFIHKQSYEIPYSSQLIIDLVEKYCKINNCKSFYVYVPSDNTKRKIYFNQSYIESLDKYINKMYNKNLINTSEEIYSDVKENFADKGHHLSPRGYNIISDRILKKISENNN